MYFANHNSLWDKRQQLIPVVIRHEKLTVGLNQRRKRKAGSVTTLDTSTSSCKRTSQKKQALKKKVYLPLR